MGRKFYVVLASLLICSVLLLGMSYSKQSSDNSDTGLIETNTDNYRVVYSTEEALDTMKGNKVRFSLVNKKDSDTSYVLVLNEVDEDAYENVSYTIDGVNYYALTENSVNLGSLKAYGTDGDTGIYNVSLKSSNKYIFDYYIEEVSYGS